MTGNENDFGTALEQPPGKSDEKKRGLLKIYFGYAAGVGKTCAMLKDAHEMKSNGVDVVAGYIEPHARPETAALLVGLETLPFLQISYKNLLRKIKSYL